MISLTATELPRFMACNGSRLMGGITPFDSDDSVKDEGDAAHWLVEQVFKGVTTADALLDKQAPNGVFITANMIEHCEEYLQDIKTLGGVVEFDTSAKHEKWEVRSRLDHGAQHGNVLHINDFKYGWKIVEPENNWTLLWHAISWCYRYQGVETIVLRIYQPRAYHPTGKVREWRITSAQLLAFAEQLNRTMLNPSDMVVSGELQCYKCPSRSQCPAAQIATMNSIDVAEKVFDSHVNNAQLSFMLDQTARAIKMLEQSQDAYQELALHRIKVGQTIPEYSVQTDLGNKQWKEGLTPDIVQMIVGVDVSKKQLLTPNQAVKMGASEEAVSSLTERNNKGFKLVRVDERKQAEKLFKGKK